MDLIMPVSELRMRLPEMIKKVADVGKHLVITKNGRPEAVMISPEELETLEIRADRDLLLSIERAQRDVAAGRVHTYAEVFG